MISVIVPTYREAENLAVLVPRIAAALAQANLQGEILIIDDNSPDGTPAVCALLAARYPVRLLVRTDERGLSSAVVYGMRQAKGDILVVMDADLSHPPEKIPDLVRALTEQQAEFAIGSRYVKGGQTEEGWGLLRWLNSKVATLMAWPLTRAADPMAGFFALRRTTFEANLHLDPIGYKIGLELIVKCGCKRVAEVPIAFANRLHGSSKLTFKEQVNYVRHLKRLYEFKFGWPVKLAQFVFVGLTGIVVDLVCYLGFMAMLPLAGARAAAIVVAMTWNFFLNRHVTFSFARKQAFVPQYLSFCLSCGFGALVSWGVSVGLPAVFGLFTGQPLVAAVLGIIVGSIFNFVLCQFAVFRPARAASVRAVTS